MTTDQSGIGCGGPGAAEAPPCCREAGTGPYRATVLAAAVMLHIADRPVHGYQLVEETEALVGHMVAVDKGSIYRLLRSFQQQGLLASDWETPDAGPPRRVYRLTAQGAECLERISEGLKVRAACIQQLARQADEAVGRMATDAGDAA